MVAAALRSHEQGRDDQEPGVPNASSRTLLSRLVDECAVLSETEIQDNLHSALLAGYQASAVLTAFVLLELASRPNLQVPFLVCYPHSPLFPVPSKLSASSSATATKSTALSRWHHAGGFTQGGGGSSRSA